MPRLTRITVTALENVSVVTARKKLPYRKVEGMNGDVGMPEGQTERYDQVHGLSLQEGQIVDLDVTKAQLPAFQEAVDAGKIEVVIHDDQMVRERQMTPATPPAKGDAKK